MNKAEAREVLIQALVKDFVQTMYDDGAFPHDVAEIGHIGFRRRSNNELVQNALDMGLDRDSPVADAIKVLEAP